MYNGKGSPGFKFRPRLNLYTDGVNNTFDHIAFEARSYRWWLYLCKIKGKVVFNGYYYSSQTSGHQSNMRDLLKQLKIKIDIEVNVRCSLGKLSSESLEPCYERMFGIQIKAKRAAVLKRKVDKTGDAAQIKEIKAEIKLLRSLGAKYSPKDIADLKAKLEAREERRIEELEAHAAERAAERRTLEPEMNDLSIVDLGFEKMDDLNSVNLNNLGVSNVLST